MITTIKSFDKTLLYTSAVDVVLTVVQGVPIVQTNTLFTKYFYTKEVTITGGTLFSVYNCSTDDLIIELDISSCIVVKEEYSDYQCIGTGRIRKGKERLSIFNRFLDHYSLLGYRVLTADTDHPKFNRAASRNVLASIFPNNVMVLIDGDTFYSKEQIEKAIEYAQDNDVIVKPTKFAEVDNKKVNGYSGYCWVVKTKLWPGMDERCLTWGAEDIILRKSRMIRTEELNNGVAQVSNHRRDEAGNSHNPYNFSLLKDYEDKIGFPLSKEKVLHVFINHCGYGSYGHFSEPSRLVYKLT
jgi:hypothetical protein